MAVATVSEAQNFWQSCLRTRLVDTDGISAFSLHEATITARQQLLIELTAIQHVVALVAARVNDMSITARLPPEVLVHVFTSLYEYDPPSSMPLPGDKRVEKYHKPHLGWIVATHVCRRWRHVALSTPHLWTNVGSPHTAFWMAEMLIRSKQVPFTLSVCVEAEGSGVFNTLLKAVGPDHVSRMSSLHLAVEEHPVHREAALQNFDLRMSQLQAALTYPAYILESLTLDHLDVSSHSLQNIFGSTLPRLRRLSYHYCIKLSRVNAPYLHNVVDLEIYLEQARTALSSVLWLLKKLPQLENLVVKHDDPCPYEPPVEEAPIERVPLHSLKTLYLDGHASHHITRFLHNLSIAPTARREIKLRRISGWQLHGIVPVLIDAAFGDHVITSLSPSTNLSPSAIEFGCKVHSDGYPLISFRTWAGDDTLSSKPRFTVHLTTPGPHRGPATQLLFRSFDLHSVTYLAFNLADGDEHLCNILRNSFSRLPAVREIALQGASTGALLRLLQVNVATPEAQNMESNPRPAMEQISGLFPRLTSLRISEVNFEDAVTLDGEGMSERAFGDLLLGIIRGRATLGERLCTLSIIHCKRVKPSLLVHLRSHVADLHYEE